MKTGWIMSKNKMHLKNVFEMLGDPPPAKNSEWRLILEKIEEQKKWWQLPSIKISAIVFASLMLILIETISVNNRSNSISLMNESSEWMLEVFDDVADSMEIEEV